MINGVDNSKIGRHHQGEVQDMLAVMGTSDEGLNRFTRFETRCNSQRAFASMVLNRGVTALTQEGVDKRNLIATSSLMEDGSAIALSAHIDIAASAVNDDDKRKID